MYLANPCSYSAFYVLHSVCLFLNYFLGNGFIKHPLDEKPEGSESSDGEFDVISLTL
jgi:hypothetical protein